MNRDTVDALCDPAAWPHEVGRVELIETHASWVFLTGTYAYKVKKPVDFGFLDFSTLARRLHCCREELRLNRRLASALYLDVVPIAGSPPRAGGDGEPFEYAVKMRQFDTELGFDRLAARGRLDAAMIDATAAAVATFHAGIEVAAEDSGFGTPREIARQARENFEQIEAELDEQAPGSRERFDHVANWSRARGEALADVFAARLAHGFVRECHGDLHLRNIVWWEGQVLPFDCIEFNPTLRWIDVMSELAFLLMDLDDHGLPHLSTRLLNAYLEHRGDYGGLKVLRYYQAYRAMVRAKVESLRLAQLDSPDQDAAEELEAYITLADGYTRDPVPRLIIAHGLSGSGKTYVSQRLMETTPLIRLRSDVERKRLFGLASTEASGSGPDAGIYTREATARTYGELARVAELLLRDGWPVLVDAAFLKRSERDTFRALAETCGCPFAIMHCEAEISVQRQRVAERTGDASEADVAVLERQREWTEPLQGRERDLTIRIDTTGAPDLQGLLAFLERGEGATWD